MKTQARRIAQGIVFAFMISAAAVPALAQSNDVGGNVVRGLLGLFSRASTIAQAKKRWAEVDPDMQVCVVRKTGLTTDQMSDRGIGPDDTRLELYFQTCQREARQAREAEEQARARAAQEEAARQVQEATAKEALKQARLAAAAAKAAQEARHKELTAKYGANIASAIESGQVRTGMTKDEVLAVRGAPPGRETVPPDYEVWHYAAGDVAFTNGHVSYVAH
jgi:hypothetical protein